MEQESGSTQRTPCVGAHAASLLIAIRVFSDSANSYSVDMYSTLGKKSAPLSPLLVMTNCVIVVGAVKDVSFLIDVLPAYLFPHDERIIGEWVLAGFSLGGHATWLGLTHGALFFYPSSSQSLS